MLAIMVGDSKPEVHDTNGGEEVEGSSFFDEREVDMHIDSTTRKLKPELRELAQIVAKSLYERHHERSAGLPKHMIHARIVNFGSKKLKQLYQERSSYPSFIKKGYIDIVTSQRALFRQYRDQLVSTMIAENKDKVHHQNASQEERGTHIDRSVPQGQDSVDGDQKGNVDDNYDEGQENRIDNAKTGTKESELNASDNHFRLASAAEAQNAKRVAETKRPYDVIIDDNLNRSKKGDECCLSASPSLPVCPPSVMSPDLEELARLVVECMCGSPSVMLPDLQELPQFVAECMSANSNKICHEMLALKVLGSECQMLKDRWNGVARLARFQRNSYSMLIPQSMRKTFQIHLVHLISSWNHDTTGLGVATVAAKNETVLATGQGCLDTDHVLRDKELLKANNGETSCDNWGETICSNVDLDRNKNGDGAKTPNESTQMESLPILSCRLSPEIKDLAQIAAKCLYERPDSNGRVPRHLVHDMIATFGSARLKEFWREKLFLLSVSQQGYIGAVLKDDQPSFRLYRDHLLAVMASECKAEVYPMNVGEDKGSGFFGDGEGDMHIDSTKQIKESPIFQLPPELRELAQIVAKCLYERHNGNKVSMQVLRTRVATFGSDRLKQLWEQKSSHPSFRNRFVDVVSSSSKRTLFRQYRDQLLSTMVAESKDESHDHNVGEERGIRDDKSVLQEKYSVDGDGKAKSGTKENESNASDNYIRLAPAAKRATETRRTNDVVIDGILSRSKRRDEGRLSASPSLPVICPPSVMPPDLQELARLVAECMVANSNKVCHETLALKMLSSECQMLKDRWNGVARLSRFQRDGYSMLIPQSMRKTFQISLDLLISSLDHEITGLGVAAEKQNSKPNWQLKKSPPVTTPRSQKKPNQLTETGTIAALSVTTKYQAADDLDDMAKCWETNSNTFTDFPDDDGAFLEAAGTATRKRHNTKFSNENHGREDHHTKRLKTALGTVPSKSIKECIHEIILFFKWRHRRLDLAQEQFLDESKSEWQIDDVDRAKSNLKAHHDVELDKLKKLEKSCCTKFRVGSSYRESFESFFEHISVNWIAFFDEVVKAWSSFGREDYCPEVSEGKQRDRYKFFLDAEKVWVQRHIEVLSSE